MESVGATMVDFAFSFNSILSYLSFILDFATKVLAIYLIWLAIKAVKLYIKNNL